MHKLMAFVVESTRESSSDGIEGVGRRRMEDVHISSSLKNNGRESRDIGSLLTIDLDNRCFDAEYAGERPGERGVCSPGNSFSATDCGTW
jgi:hypothetical protein